MKKKTRNFIIIPLLIVLSLATIYGITFYFSFFQKTITIADNKMTSTALPTGDFKSTYEPKLKFEDTPISTVSDITLNILGKSVLKDMPVLLKSQRYYIPINIISKELGYEISSTNDSTVLTNGANNISISKTNYKTNFLTGSLRGNILTKDNESYISISDIEQIFNLTAVFKFDTKSIHFVHAQPKTINTTNNVSSEGRIALIRLEDVTAGDGVASYTNQPKFKALGDFLYSEGIKYHIAWIPRFKAPSDNIDNDLLTNKTFENVSFINLLDYMINRGAEIGLHGYTHQSEDSRSGVGTELSNKIHNNTTDTRNVIEMAIDTATALNIPYSFFESPHYKATKLQKEVIEEYIQYIYEPKNYVIYHKLQKTKNNNLYIPTPLSYVRDLDVSHIERGLSNPRPGELASMFYHPGKEFDFIDIDTNNNSFNVSYSLESPLQKIVKSIKDNNCVTVHITQLKNN